MRPKKSLSQNFLINEKAAKRIVDSLEIQKDDTVLEIGPGKGALTKYLLEKAKKVIAVEIDKELCQYLVQRFAEKSNLVLINQDILKIDLKELIQKEKISSHAPHPGPFPSFDTESQDEVQGERGLYKFPPPFMGGGEGEGDYVNSFRIAGQKGPLKVIGNLPYQITSPLLSLLLEKREFLLLSVLMVQREVAKRICAQPESKDWSPLSIAIQLHSEVKTLFNLKPTSFFPAPKVESSVIRIVFLKRPKVLIADEKLFFTVVRSAFGQRRKTILNSLSSNLNLPKREMELILNKVKIDPKRRPETLSIEEFADLSRGLGNLLN